MSYGDLVDEVLIHLTLVIDYITYAYNTLVSIILIKFLNQSPLHVHNSTSSYHPAVLVTGTSSGIGRDVALTLAKQGYTVFATVRREVDAEELKNRFAELDNAMNGKLIPLIMDVTNKDDIQKAYDSVRTTIGREIPFVGLVNNAALIFYVPLEIASESCYEDSFNTNYFSIINLTKKFLPLLRESRGRVVNVGSIASWGPAPSMGIYSATKAAIRAITQVWRMETRSMGIHFSLVEPGVVSTRFTESQMKAYRASMIPPAVVSDAIVHALTAPYPKNTYYVGLDARLIAVANWFFGDRIIEAVQSKALAVPNDMITVM
ncbi:17382_t:CDS:2 [Funneliformis caledonium]|uniref:17382_t:CDS:1 n=1 Tax=Funneliformis caledonium TaxID=1117310 RepID=A0A9N9GZI1_9GLOM|nr:17382_t:CDS:2 [Funneliformis caledonium]